MYNTRVLAVASASFVSFKVVNVKVCVLKHFVVNKVTVLCIYLDKR